MVSSRAANWPVFPLENRLVRCVFQNFRACGALRKQFSPLIARRRRFFFVFFVKNDFSLIFMILREKILKSMIDGDVFPPRHFQVQRIRGAFLGVHSMYFSAKRYSVKKVVIFSLFVRLKLCVSSSNHRILGPGRTIIWPGQPHVVMERPRKRPKSESFHEKSFCTIFSCYEHS